MASNKTFKKKDFYASVDEDFPESSEFVKIDFCPDMAIFSNKESVKWVPVKIAAFIRTQYTNLVSFFSETSTHLLTTDRVTSLEAPLNGMDFAHMALYNMLTEKFGGRISEYMIPDGLITLGGYFSDEDSTLTMLFCVVTKDFELGEVKSFVPISDVKNGIIEAFGGLDKYMVENILTEVAPSDV